MEIPDSLAALQASDQGLADARNEATSIVEFWAILHGSGMPRRLAEDLVRSRCQAMWSATWITIEPEDE